MEEVKLLCAFVEEELSWIVQFFHDVLNKEVTASRTKSRGANQTGAPSATKDPWEILAAMAVVVSHSAHQFTNLIMEFVMVVS